MKKYAPMAIALLTINATQGSLAWAAQDADDEIYTTAQNADNTGEAHVNHQRNVVEQFAILSARTNYLAYLDQEERAIESARVKDLAKLKRDQEKLESQRQKWMSEAAKIEAAQKADENYLQTMGAEKKKLEEAYFKQNEEYERLRDLAYKKGKRSTESKEMFGALKDLNKLGQQNTETEKSLAAARKRVEDYEKHQSDVNSRLAQIQPQIDARETKIFSSITTLSEYDKFSASKRAADQILENQKDSGYNAKLMFWDFKTLETKNHMSKMEIEGLKASVNERLGNTLMGNYVNEQITKVMSNFCSLQAECSVKSSTEMNVIVKKLLAGPSGGSLPFENNSEVKDPGYEGDEATKKDSGKSRSNIGN